MMEIYKSINGCVARTEEIAPNTWINLVAPTEEEQAEVIERLKLEPSFFRFALDEEELSHVDAESDQKLVIIDIPTVTMERDVPTYSTIPLAIIVAAENVITVCTKEPTVLADIVGGTVRGIQLNMKTRFVLQILFRVAVKFVAYLKQLDRMSSEIERSLQKSQRNKELLQLMAIEKSLVYFSTSLKANDITLQKIQTGRLIKLYDEDTDLLEDVIIEIKQAIEMCTIYREILSGTTDTFASIISNNLNIVMKVLTSITILMAIPNMVTGYFGMNVNLPFVESGHVPLLISLGCVLLVSIYLRKKDML